MLNPVNGRQHNLTKSDEYLDEIINFYRNDVLHSRSAVQGEYERWHYKWKEAPPNTSTRLQHATLPSIQTSIICYVYLQFYQYRLLLTNAHSTVSSLKTLLEINHVGRKNQRLGTPHNKSIYQCAVGHECSHR